jgi:hypothetical protein
MTKSFSMKKIYAAISLHKILLACFSFCTLGGFSGNVTTTSGGSWTNGGNWSTGSAPNTGSDNIFVTKNITVNTNIAMSGSAELTVTGTLIDPSGGSAYSLSISNSAIVDIEGNTTFEGALLVQNNATLTIGSGDTLTVGSASFINNSVLVIASGGVLIVNGDLVAANNNGTTINGSVIVNGNVTASNNSVFDGTGDLSASGTISTSGGSTIFGGSGSCTNCSVSSGSSLPVELTSFKAFSAPESVDLKWTTATETDNDHFEILRSQDGVTYTHLASVKAAGSGYSLQTQSYKSTDNTPLGGVSYYKLKQVDKNGNFKCYEAISVDRLQHSFANFYPNPASAALTVRISDDCVGYSVKIFTITGEEIGQMPLTSSLNQFDISFLPAGLYYLGLETGSFSQKIRLAVQK